MSIYYPTITKQLKTLPIYLTSAGIFFEETTINRDNGYSDFQWITTVSGHGELTIDETTYHLDSNIGIFIPAHIPHSYQKTSDHWITHWITFNGHNITQVLDFIDLGTITIINLNDTHIKLREIEDIYYLATGNYTKHAFKISSLLYAQLEGLYELRTGFDELNLESKNNHMNVALEYIDQYYMMELTINEIANFIHISPQYLCRIFKQQLNLRPFEYIKQVRINKSKSMLLKTPTPKIEEVSRAVGFGNPSYYTSIFKIHEKITPREFIKLHQRGV